MKRLAPLMLCAVLAALLGGAGGFYLGHSRSPGPDPMIDLFTAAQLRYSSYLFAIRKDRNNEVHEDDLRSYLSYLDERARDRDPSNPNLYAFDRAIALIRLSQLAQSRGATAAAAQLIKDADAMCPAIGLGNCSANVLLGTTRERDRRAWSNPGNTGTR